MKLRIIMSIFLAILLQGCARKPALGPMPIASPSDNPNIKLAEAATSVSHSLAELARIQAVATPAVRDSLPNPNLYGLKRLASVDWAGPIEQITRKAAKAADYKIRVLGRAPAIPIIITISARNTPLGSIARDIDFQAGKRAHIKIYSSSRTIELRYAKA